MTSASFYPIGTPLQPWGAAEKQAWLAAQVRHRSYADDVVARVDRLRARFDVSEYGRLVYGDESFPQLAIRSRNWNETLPTILVTGGVHGYETSGVHGALQFVEQHGEDYAGRVNLLVVPCVSPWAYERIHRWNPNAIDPNRSFRENSPSEESAALLRLVAPLRDKVLVHIDLHETTDTDDTEFRPALAARDGKPTAPEGIPDGFYLVGDERRPAAGIPAGDHRGGGEGDAHRAARREQRDHRIEGRRARRHQLCAARPRAVHVDHEGAVSHDDRGVSG